jgi:two-component system sensor histidine kinase YesM
MTTAGISAKFSKNVPDFSPVSLNSLLSMKIFNFIRKSIHRKFLTSFIIVSIIPIAIITLTTYNIYFNSIEEKAIHFNYELLQTIGKKIEDYINKIEHLSYAVYQDPVQKILRKPPYLLQTERVLDLISIEKAFTQQMNLYNMSGQINGITLIEKQDDVFFIGSGALDSEFDIHDSAFYNAVIHAKSHILFPPHYQPYLYLHEYRVKKEYFNDLCITYGAKIGSIDSAAPQMGVILIDFNLFTIESAIQPFLTSENTTVSIIDSKGKIIYDNNHQKIGTQYLSKDLDILFTENSLIQKERSDKKLITFSPIMNGNWNIVGSIPMNDLLTGTDQIRFWTLLLAGVSIIISIFASVVLSVNLERPIKKLEKTMKEVEKGNFDVRVSITSIDEMAALGKGFNTMTMQVQNLIDRVFQIQLKEQEAELNALQSQINPHFLYNTMETISSIAEIKEVEEISQIAKALSNMFRYSTKQGMILVTIAEEIEHVHDYIKILNIRHGEKYKINIDIPEAVMQCTTLKLILQPIVENAVYHGLEPGNGSGAITIRGLNAGNEIHLFISDDGIGFTPKKLEQERKKLNNLSHTEQNKKSGTIGITNVHERIRLYFGREYGISIDSTYEHGTTVMIKLPVTYTERPNDNS